jgi:hypothetical protein
MSIPPCCKSEVAQLLEQIELEYQGARNGLQGLSEGSTRHEVITAKMERVADRVDELTTLVGVDEALALIAETINKTPADSPSHL